MLLRVFLWLVTTLCKTLIAPLWHYSQSPRFFKKKYQRMSDLSELYQELILDLSRRPQGYGPLLGASHQSRGQNPLCGDDVTLALILGTNQIKKIQFTGQGCAILKASASVLTKLITGRSVTVALELADDFCLALVQVSGQ